MYINTYCVLIRKYAHFRVLYSVNELQIKLTLVLPF